MVSEILERELHTRLSNLPPEKQREVLNFARSLSVTGTPGKELLQFAGSIPADDLALMSQAIEEGCEDIEHNDW